MAKGITTGELDVLTNTELLERLEEAKKELFNLCSLVVTHRLENSGRLKEVRRDIVRIYMVRREREFGTRAAPTAEKQGKK